jgi:hypothetical protein
MNVMPFDIPRASLLDREVVNAAFFHESYCAPLAQSNIPFHRWGVQRLIFNAIRAGRL